MSYLQDEILRACTLLGKTYPHYEVEVPCIYIVDKNVVGLGWTNFFIQAKPMWMVVSATFLHNSGRLFNKVLLTFFDDRIGGTFLNRCHSIYIDEEDLKKAGGTPTEYRLSEVIACLLRHAETNNEKTCDGCRGENPLQTHYIKLLEKTI